MAPQLNMPLIDLSTDRLRFYRQIGADEVTLPGEWFTPAPHSCPPSGAELQATPRDPSPPTPATSHPLTHAHRAHPQGATPRSA